MDLCPPYWQPKLIPKEILFMNGKTMGPMYPTLLRMVVADSYVPIRIHSPPFKLKIN